jgi:hypothetical protein
MKQLIFIVDSRGHATCIYDDALADLLKEGKVTIKRMSSVEPDDNGNWIAHMVDGTNIGPFRLRQEALDAEIKYLEDKLLEG